MRNLLITLFLSVTSIAFCYTEKKLSPQNALQRLMNGNQRYVEDRLEHPNRTSERREASQSIQFPYAVIVGCSDSRVSPEIIFDEGIGDLFVVRVAGNVIGSLEMESVLYAATALKSVLVLVLGHENCGAVKAVVDGNTKSIPALANIIAPAIQEAKEEDPSHLLVSSVKANAIHMKELLLKHPPLSKLFHAKKIEIVAGYYNLQTGVVDLL